MNFENIFLEISDCDSLDDLKDQYLKNLKDIKRIRIDIKNLKNIKEFKCPLEVELDGSLNVIIGENGTGKSTILTVLGQMLNHNALKTEFKGKGYEDSFIQYVINDKIKFEWKKKNPKTGKDEWTLITKNNIQTKMFKIRGFYEASIIGGTRFNYLNYKNKILDYIEENSKLVIDSSIKQEKVSEYISRVMNKSYDIRVFEYQFKWKTKNGDLKSKKMDVYFNMLNGKIIPEFMMSTGEYFLLNLFKFIIRYIDKDEKKLIIIDEIDMALHPKALKNLANILQSLLKKNITFIIATHALPIIYSVKSNNLIYVNNQNGIVSFQRGRKAGYIASYLDDMAFFDRIILVEDVLTLDFIKRLIEYNEDIQNKAKDYIYEIIPIGGWNETINFALNNKRRKILRVVQELIILDGDVQEDRRFIERNKEEKLIDNINLAFLPFSNIEKLFSDELIQKEDFKSIIKNRFLGVDNFESFFYFSSGKNKNQYKSNFKIFIEKLEKEKNVSRYEIESCIFEYIIKNYKSELENLIKRLKNFFGG